MAEDNPWSIQSYDFNDEGVGFGFVSRADRDMPWRAYFAPVSRDEPSFDGSFATAEEAKAAVDAIADRIRAKNVGVSV